MEHLQTIPSTMADRERPYEMEKARISDQFGSQGSLSNISQRSLNNMGSQQRLLSDSQTNLSSSQVNGNTFMAGNRSSSGQLVSRNKFEPQPKRTLG